MLQGILRDAITFPLMAPPTAGHSIDYLIQAGVTFSDTDTLTLPFYNSATPARPLMLSVPKRRAHLAKIGAKARTL